MSDITSETVRRFLREFAENVNTTNLNRASGQQAIMAVVSNSQTTGYPVSIAGIDMTIYRRDAGFDIMSSAWHVVMRRDYKASLEDLKAGRDLSTDTVSMFGDASTFDRDITMMMLAGAPDGEA